MSRAGQSVLIMAGGTGGHIFPGLAVADSLRQRGVEVRWLGARGGMECQRVPAWGIPIDVVDISGLRGKGAVRWLLVPWKLLRAVSQAVHLLGKQRPACAISFGGYAAGPGGLAAKLRGVPLLVHEQNRVPGLTNRVLARLASRVLQAFPGTWQERLHPLTCGNPVRQDVAALDAPGERLVGRSGPVRVLVTGGSQGARALNRLLPAGLRLAPEGLSLEVRHQCGRSWQEETEAAYRAAGFEISGSSPVGAASAAISEPPAGDIAAEAAPTAAPTAGARRVVKVTEFIEDMADAYGWADLVVCRAGALTVSEVAAAGVAAVFVPFPHAVDDHQTRNAEYLTERGAALLLGEAGLDAERLARDLNPLLADRARLLDMATRARGAATPDAAKRVAGLCSEYLTS